MPEILIAALSPAGHFDPLVTVARGLVARGDRVTFLTSGGHAARVRAVGATPAALPREADLDLSGPAIDLVGRADTSGISSRDAVPAGLGMAPSSSWARQVRNRALNLLSHRVLLRESHNVASLLLDHLNCPPLPMFVLDSGLLADRHLRADRRGDRRAYGGTAMSACADPFGRPPAPVTPGSKGREFCVRVVAIAKSQPWPRFRRRKP